MINLDAHSYCLQVILPTNKPFFRKNLVHYLKRGMLIGADWILTCKWYLEASTSSATKCNTQNFFASMDLFDTLEKMTSKKEQKSILFS